MKKTYWLDRQKTCTKSLGFLTGLFHCIGPTLYSVLIAAGATGSSSGGMAVMLLFSLGLAIPYLLVALSIGAALIFYRNWDTTRG
ncbi:MAG: urease accessory protein UreH domain-containing protein [Thermincolia bacterium]